MENKVEIDVMVADASHEVYVDTIFVHEKLSNLSNFA